MQTLTRSIRRFDAIAQTVRRWCSRTVGAVAGAVAATMARDSAAERDTTAESDEHSSIAGDETKIASELALGSDDGPWQESGEVVLQQVMRIRDSGGQESVYATLRAEFLAGQRYASLHVAFLPAFAELPTIAAEVIEGPSAAVKVVQAMHHGVELEVRLEESIDAAAFCTVEMAAYPVPADPDTTTDSTE